LWLAGCETTSNLDNPFRGLGSLFQSQPGDAQPDGDVTGSVPQAPPQPSAYLGTPSLTPEVLGNDPNDDLSIGKKYFRQGAYGTAERHFRKAVELHPRDAEAWVGLAASYDRLRRFDLADRAYAQAAQMIGPTPELLNNQGFSYMLRGDYRRARATLLAAQAKDPSNPYVQNNLRLLEATARKAKAVN
jgi:Flp pilus assembly protein TadD